MKPTAITVPVEVILELTHAAPSDGGLTRCCDHTPFELKTTDRLTDDMAQVTCPGAWLKKATA